MSATEMANKFFGDFVPGCFIHEGFVEKRSLRTSLPTKRSRRDEIRTGRHGNPTSIEKTSSSWTTWDTMHLGEE
jgi:hypothetical protein